VEKDRLDLAVRGLVRIGLDRVSAFLPASELEAFRVAGGRLEATPEVDVRELKKRQEKGDALVLDVRRAGEFSAGRLRGAKNIAHTRLAERLKELPRDRPILVHCQGGTRSAFATALLRREGFDATNVAGGFGAWEKAGFDVER